MNDNEKDDLIVNELTNDDVVAGFPKNDNGQVEIDENGFVKGLTSTEQPTHPAGEPAQAEETQTTEDLSK